MWDSTANHSGVQGSTTMHLGLFRGELGGTGDHQPPRLSLLRPRPRLQPQLQLRLRLQLQLQLQLQLRMRLRLRAATTTIHA